MNNSAFFSFGLDDSYISKSFEGLGQNLPPTLHRLISSGNVAEVNTAALGPLPESWVLSYRDTQGKNRYTWGRETPPELAKILRGSTATPHLHVFLGPLLDKKLRRATSSDQKPTYVSFIAWDPNFIRWRHLPDNLEAALQQWLTPAGWRYGPPRMVSWGHDSTFIAISEYGECVHSVDEESWPTLHETIEEWMSENVDSLRDFAYTALDPTTPDQFIALRHSRIWAGAIDDQRSSALESFAHNYFSRTRSNSKAKSQPKSDSQPTPPSNSTPASTILDAHSQALYEKWATEVETMLSGALAAISNTATATVATKSRQPKKLQVRSQTHSPPPLTLPTRSPSTLPPRLLTTFPHPPIPPTPLPCKYPPCLPLRLDPLGLRACPHDVESLFRASGLYSYEWLRQERLRWHPDRFGRLCEEGFREEGRRKAEELFKICGGLMGGLEPEGGEGEEGDG
ncbi:hypothetical protein BCR34DRAFT_653153 [Clohesyomyces aquaticus]|uniref:Uncharacterized protein n=1 Tax=Clohesyomyces aquaticus TaxID=1231657 RepID=A0A1Y1ZM57_9PLEO|nr:hypothetical protein BCR34DRAFT_653153 [Clohesyomyces aquaticus]